MKLKWNVYRINNSKDKVETFNVFDHFSFNNETIRLLNLVIKEYIGNN